MKILLTGVPGSGKSYLGKILQKKYNLQFFCLTDFIIENRLYREFDKELSTYIYDDEEVEEVLLKQLPRSYIIESHSPTSLQNIKFTHIVHLRCSLTSLNFIYEERKYGQKKINENIDSFCLDEIGGEIDDYFSEIPLIEYNREVETVEKIFNFLEA